MLKVLLVFLAAIMFSCASTEINTVEDAKESYEYGLKLIKNGRYMQAREVFERIKNKLPDSSFAILAELRIADSYFEEESYPEAISSYEVFEEMHPKHPEREFVIYRIALSYYQDSPSAIDRDLGPAKEAVKHFSRLLKMFPETKYKNEALATIKKSREKLLEKEYYIARYYYIRDHYKAAVGRYEGIYSNFSDIKNATKDKSIVELWKSYGKLKDKENQKRIKTIVQKEYPNVLSKLK